MKKLLFTAGILCSLSITSNAQTKLKYETIFFSDESVETSQLKIAATNGVSENEFIKAKVKIVNYTAKAIMLRPEDCYYSTIRGDIPCTDSWMIIGPHQEGTKVIDVKGLKIKTDTTTLKLNGLYICNNEEIMTVSDMALPPQKELAVGNFILTLEDYDRDGREVLFRYNVKYLGTKVGLFNPSKVILKSPDGGEYKNQKDKDKVFAFKKHQDFRVAFLFFSDSKKDNIISWKDAFTEGQPEKMENISVKLKMDLGKTKEKN